ncbi:MAG: hypothetical protein WCF19_08060 [Chlamydiales bacterium]
MNGNEQLARQMRQIVTDIDEYFNLKGLENQKKNPHQIEDQTLESVLACPLKNEIPNSLCLRSSDTELLLWPGLRLHDQEEQKKVNILSINLKNPSFIFFHNPFFDPRLGETIAQSYERFLAFRRSRKHRKYSELIGKWGQKLEGVIFKKSRFIPLEHLLLIRNWERMLFNPIERNSKKMPIKGRWKEGEAIDILTAARLILYFAKEFIQKPHKLKSAKIACLLWLLIRLTIIDGESFFSLDYLTSLKVSDLHLESEIITIEGSSFPISNGLSSLLSILISLSPNLLFEGILVDSLDNLFKTISPSICRQEKPILPSAFLSFPHLWIGHRIPQPLLHSKRQGFVLSQQLHYECLLKSLGLPTQCFYQSFLDQKKP